MSNKFERLSNDVLLDIFDYVDASILFYTFWGLNSRLNNVLRSLNNLSILVRPLVISRDYGSVFSLLNHKIKRLVIECGHFDLNQFPNLRSLVLPDATHQQIERIQPDLLPNLAFLKLSSPNQLLMLDELVYDILSNRFRSLHHADLNVIVPKISTLSRSPILRSLCIVSDDPSILCIILNSCIHLNYLKMLVTHDPQTVTMPLTPNHHPLKHFILQDIGHTLSVDTVQILLAYVLSVEVVFLKFACTVPFFDFVASLSARLRHLRRFNCRILECLTKYENDDIDAIRQIHPCFNRIRCMTTDNGMRFFYPESSGKIGEEVEF